MGERDVLCQVFYLQKQFWTSEKFLDLQKCKTICDHKMTSNLATKTKTFCQNTKNVLEVLKWSKNTFERSQKDEKVDLDDKTFLHTNSSQLVANFAKLAQPKILHFSYASLLKLI